MLVVSSELWGRHYAAALKVLRALGEEELCRRRDQQKDQVVACWGCYLEKEIPTDEVCSPFERIPSGDGPF